MIKAPKYYSGGRFWRRIATNTRTDLDERHFHVLDTDSPKDKWETTDLESLLVLRGLVQGLRARYIVETGTYKGVGTSFLLDGQKRDPAYSVNTHHLWTVDSDHQPEVNRFSAEKGVTFLIGESQSVPWAGLLGKRKIELVFVDCWSRIAALKNVLPHCSPRCMIVLHDWSHSDSKRLHAGIEKLYKSKPGLTPPVSIGTSRGLAICNVVL